MRALTVLAFLEANTVTGPAANLLQFHRTTMRLAPADRDRVRLLLAVFQRGGPSASVTPLTDAAERAGLPVYMVCERFRFDPRSVTAMRRLTRQVNPDIVETHSVKSHALVRLAGIAAARRWVAFHHGYTRPDAKMTAYNQCDRLSLRRADRVVTPAQAFVDEIAAAGVSQDRISVVHNAIDCSAAMPAFDQRRRLRERFGVGDGERVVVCVARLSAEKGHRDLIEALARARRDGAAPFRLVLAGDGPERPALEALARDAGVASAIVWLGHVDQAHRLYAAADAAVLPSYSEGSPNALLEAAAYRLPIVATTVGGVPEIVADGDSALLVAPRRPDRLAAALQAVVSDRVLAAKLGRKARAVVETRHHPVDRTRRLIALYDDVAGANDTRFRGENGARTCAF